MSGNLGEEKNHMILKFEALENGWVLVSDDVIMMGARIHRRRSRHG